MPSSMPLLTTKLYLPPARRNLVSRPRLTARLGEGLTRPLTLISAPAGYGKTTLISEWRASAAGRDFPLAWLSLDEGDNDTARFLTYVIAALAALKPGFGEVTLGLVGIPQPPPPQAILTNLVNELSGIEGPFALVLDDYHVIAARPIHDALTFLLDHLPPQMRLVLLTRADPPLPLARLRARDQLTEIRAADLRFTVEEATAFLDRMLGLALAPEQVAALEQRTEGWIAGLQLAALSAQRRSDLHDFITAFAGSHRYIVDYLAEEVLNRQPEPVRDFLLRTSILKRLCGELCDAVTDEQRRTNAEAQMAGDAPVLSSVLRPSSAVLEDLDRANLFLIPLDDERRWYRYHHLFGDVLRQRLQEAHPDLPVELRRRASEWHEHNGFTLEAIEYALAARDFERAGRLLDPIGAALAARGSVQLVLRWIEALPEALLQAQPRLMLIHATALTFANQLAAAQSRAQQAQAAVPDDGSVTAYAVRGWANVVLATTSLYAGDIAASVALAREGLALLPPTETVVRASAAALAARAYQLTGDVTTPAETQVAAAAENALVSGSPVGIVSSLANLAWLYVLQGRLRQAMAAFERLADAMPAAGVLPNVFNSLSYYVGLGYVLRERNELDAAEASLAQGMALVRSAITAYPHVVTLGYIAWARLWLVRGDIAAAHRTLDELDALADRLGYAPRLVRQAHAARVQIWLARGEPAPAARWAESSGLAADDADLPYVREHEYVALARVLIAQRRAAEAIRLLDRLIGLAEAGGRLGNVIELLALQAMAHQAGDNWTNAVAALGRALTLAQPEGYVRVFVDEGEALRTGIREWGLRTSDGTHVGADAIRMKAYVAKLLAAFGEPATTSTPQYPVPNTQYLVEPLSDRELEVLRLLAAGKSNQEIADALILALGTVKKHLNNIFGKLGVESRTQCVARARVLNLL